MHTTTLKHRCPHCNVGLETAEKMAGRSFDCPNCDGNLTVPAQHALMTMARPMVVSEIIADDSDSVQKLPRRTHRHVDDKPVKLRLGEYAELEADVDGPTRNAATLTFLGAVLALLGVIVATVLGGKSKSS